MTKRSLLPLPWRIWITIRELSMSPTVSAVTSEMRRPAA
jgi:hypothetical protein